MPELVFIGPDGSGKSTLVKLLRYYLFLHGVDFRTSWFRGPHLLASLLTRSLSCFATFRGHSNPYYGITIPPKLRLLWLQVKFFSFLPHYLTRRFLSLLSPQSVIGDFWTSIIWIVATLDHPRLLSRLLGKFLLRLATVDVNLLVTADPVVLPMRAGYTSRILAEGMGLLQHFSALLRELHHRYDQ